MDDNKINYIEAALLSVIIMIAHIILDFPNVIIESVGSSAILNVVYVTVLSLLFFIISEKLFTPFAGKNILHIAEFVGGKYLKLIISFLYSAYLIFASATVIRSFAEILQVIYFHEAYLWTIILPFIIVAIIANLSGTRTIIKANTLLVPPILFTMIIIFLSSIKNFEICNVFPIFGNGINATFISGSLNIYTFSGLIYIFLLKTNLKNFKDLRKAGYVAVFLLSAFLLLGVASLLMLFPFLKSGKNVLSVYLSTRTIQFGEFMPRTDALFMLIWIFNFLMYLSVIILLIVKINKDGISLKASSPSIYVSSILIFIVALLPQNTSQVVFLNTTCYKYTTLFVVFVTSFIILIIGNFKKKYIN